MNTRLNEIQNWPERAEQAGWSVSALAKNCGVSVQSLERHFHEKFGKSPRRWIGEMKQQRALELLSGGFNVNETATQVGYAHASTFCQKYPGLREKALKTARSGPAEGNLVKIPNFLLKNPNPS